MSDRVKYSGWAPQGVAKSEPTEADIAAARALLASLEVKKAEKAK